MSFAHKLQYAGSKPFEPEKDRVQEGEITINEYERLSEDQIYRRLAEVRWLVDQLENDLADNDVPEETRSAIFDVIATGDDAPIHVAVDTYVEAWLDEYRAANEVTA